MGRGRNPQQTRRKILDVAEKLFLEQGYDDTSIQDIIDGLGGMTKGVIYHHFASKFDILDTLMKENSTGGETFQDWHGSNGLEKLQNSLQDSFTSFKKQEMGYSAAVTLRSPRMLGEQYQQIFTQHVPELQKVVEEGVADGSIQTEFPEEVAELILITMNLWLGYQTGVRSEEVLKRKAVFIKKTFDGLGIPLITNELLQDMFKLFERLKKE